MEDTRVRTRVYIALILIAMSVLGFRLVHLQLLHSSTYSGETRSIAIREKRVTPARGALIDRNGILMVDNEATYAITITPRYFDRERIPMLADLLDVADTTVVRKLEEARAWSTFRPSVVFSEVPFEVFSRLQEQSYLLPGVWWQEEQRRRYLTPARASHILGFTREIARVELDTSKVYPYRAGDLIGKTGLEKSYEYELRGVFGSELKLVNIHGLEVSDYENGDANIDPVSGYDLHLTLDSRLQAFAESLFVNKRGGLVALDPRNGEILTMVSYPDVDPGVFARSMTNEQWVNVLSGEASPMFNRATMSMMPPGSTWKPFMALFGLQEGLITPDQKIYCPGGHPIGKGLRFRCLGVHGYIDVQTAILKSCNTFFFEVMRKADVNAFRAYANQFGFGNRIASDIGSQVAGLIPDSSYYNKTYPRGWTIGYSMNLGIGQGDMGVTAMQLARYIGTVGMNGRSATPHVVRRLVHAESGEINYPQLKAPVQIPIDQVYFDLVKKGMQDLMEVGTGLYFQIPGFSSAGKTGTAQAPGNKEDHSIFVMFAPVEDPQIAIGVIVENGGSGARQAGPIASLVAEHYLKGEVAETPGRRYLINRLINELKSQDL